MRLIVPLAPGGATDIVARLMGQWLSERLGQPFIIENRPGAGSNIGTEAVVHAPPDGYTLLLASSANAINATLYDKLNFNFIRDIAPVATISRNTLVMVVHPSVPAKSVPEFIAYAKANPRKLNMASPGNGSPNHVSGELFKMMTGVDMVHVPYRSGGPALTDLLGGQVQVMFPATVSSIEYIRDWQAARARSHRRDALGACCRTSRPWLSSCPATRRVIGSASCAPNATPAEIVEKLNKEINAGLADPKFKARLADLGATTLPGSPADFGKLIADDTEKWAKVIQFAGIKSE